MKVLQLSPAMAAGEPVRVLDVRTPGEFDRSCDTESIVRRFVAPDGKVLP